MLWRGNKRKSKGNRIIEGKLEDSIAKNPPFGRGKSELYTSHKGRKVKITITYNGKYSIDHKAKVVFRYGGKIEVKTSRIRRGAGKTVQN